MWRHFAENSWQEAPPPNRGLLFGDGFFETLHLRGGHVLFAHLHQARFEHALRVLELSLPLSVEAIFQTIRRYGETYEAARVKVVVFRQGEGAYAPPTTTAGLYLGIFPRPAWPFPLGPGQRLVVFPTVCVYPAPWQAFKTLSAMAYVQAAAYAQRRRADDALLLATSGAIAETSRANLFFYDGVRLYTPALETGCVKGVLRTVLLALASKLGLKVEEGLYPLEALWRAQEVFTTNVIQGIAPVAQLEDYTYPTGEGTLAAYLAAQLQAELSALGIGVSSW
ncbi:MAG: aminotransferase class IV [Bacteroidia bacterium]|nr:aminotransferase class IV [Bacteroidia bacterium]MDW8089438.1 aminotransferase class IV [Bacteroidia bacterium]